MNPSKKREKERNFQKSLINIFYIFIFSLTNRKLFSKKRKSSKIFLTFDIVTIIIAKFVVHFKQFPKWFTLVYFHLTLFCWCGWWWWCLCRNRNFFHFTHYINWWCGWWWWRQWNINNDDHQNHEAIVKPKKDQKRPENQKSRNYVFQFADWSQISINGINIDFGLFLFFNGFDNNGNCWHLSLNSK